MDNAKAVPQKAVDTYRKAQEAIEQWTKIRTKARAEIEKALGDAETGTVRGTPVVNWRRGKRTALNQKLLGELYPDVKAECMDTTETRTFTLVEKADHDDGED
jgi:hypothetical protein